MQATIAVAFFGFILSPRTPSCGWPYPPLDGNDLNPLLQDPGLAFHPPFLYLGYVGLSMAYSFAIAALIEGRVDAAWARWVRPWTLLAWVFLTIGIAMGSIWAYYELGWGGWWFWDPVENVSFMPWLIAGALLHSAIVVEKRDTLKSWTILLAILAFSFSLVGAFIVRSGIITSVHAFANDPERGVYLLWILGAFIGGSLMLYAWRAPVLRSDAVFATGQPRERAGRQQPPAGGRDPRGLLRHHVAARSPRCSTGRKVSVGPPFFDLAFTPFMVALAVILPPLRGAALEARQPRPRACGRSGGALALARGARGAGLGAADRRLDAGAGRRRARAPGWCSGALAELAGRVRLGRAPAPAEVLRRARNLPRADWGKALAHAGLRRHDLRHRRDHRLGGRGHPRGDARRELRRSPATSCASTGSRRRAGPELQRRDRHASPCCATGGREIGMLHPEKRVYDVQGMATTEAAIDRSADAATSTSRSATRRRAAAGRCAPTSSPSPTGSGSGRC